MAGQACKGGEDGWRLGWGDNLVWDWLVRHIALPAGWDGRELTPEDESRVIEVLFELLDEFLAERERLEAQPQ